MPAGTHTHRLPPSVPETLRPRLRSPTPLVHSGTLPWGPTSPSTYTPLTDRDSSPSLPSVPPPRIVPSYPYNPLIVPVPVPRWCRSRSRGPFGWTDPYRGSEVKHEDAVTPPRVVPESGPSLHRCPSETTSVVDRRPEEEVGSERPSKKRTGNTLRKSGLVAGRTPYFGTTPAKNPKVKEVLLVSIDVKSDKFLGVGVGVGTGNTHRPDKRADKTCC